MDWKFAARGLARDLNRAAHVAAAIMFSAGWFSTNSVGAAAVAVVVWVTIRSLGFLLEAWAGPAP